MRRDADRQRVFSRRAAILAGGKLILFSALGARLYYLQILESERYKTLADENRINLRLLAPPRGRIVDRFGAPLAVNRQNYRAVVIPEQTANVEATLDSLDRVIALAAGDRRRTLREVKRRRGFVPVTVRENLSWEEVARVEVNAPDLPGILIEVGQSRDYPHGPETAHVLGYVAAVSEDEVGGDPLLQLPEFRVGRTGVEMTYNANLRGSGGSSQVEVNAFGRVIRELNRRDGQPGAEIALTLDLELQRFVHRRIADESGACVVIHVHSGEVLAMASSPSFDPNPFNRGLSVEAWRRLMANPRAPLINKAIAGQYAPGSAFKIVVALAALEAGVITSKTRIFCPGEMTLGDSKFHCWNRFGHGWIETAQAIVESCDVFFYEVALRTGIDRIAAMAERLGLGRLSGIDLPGEEGGLVPTREWKQAVIGGAWQPGETVITGIGQGYLLTTPLQLAAMIARVVNGGHMLTPFVARRPAAGDAGDARVDAADVEFASLGFKRDSLELLRRALSGVVNAPEGTAHRARIGRPGFEMGGKTGTVQVRRISRAERAQGVRKNEDLPWEMRDHAIFVGFAPVHEPAYAVAVVVEHGGGGSKVAAPIARDVLSEVQRRAPATGLLGGRLDDGRSAPSAPSPAPRPAEGG